MTPEELKELLSELGCEPSLLAFESGIDRSRIREFLSGHIDALSSDERNRLREGFTVSEEQRRANLIKYSAVIDGAGEFFRKRSVLFMYENAGKRLTASGTLVQLGDRLFVATAGHTIPRGTQMLEFVGANVIQVESSQEKAEGRRDWQGSSNIKVLNGKAHSKYDVGFIELATSALEVLRHDPIELSSLSTSADQYGRTAIVYGFPFDLERKRRLSESGMWLHATSLTYPSPLLAPEEWPDVPSGSRSPEIGVDCFMRYDRNDPFNSIVPIGKVRPRDASLLPDSLPAVHGMSGGGFWQRWTRDTDDQLWLACDYKLFAIQSSWCEPCRYIRGIQIRHWLDLIAESYPELREMIASHAKGIEPAHEQATPQIGTL